LQVGVSEYEWMRGGRTDWCVGQDRKENSKHYNVSQHDSERREV
jgi:hypothetical protein